MDPSLLLGPGLSIGGALLGDFLAGDDDREAERLYREAAGLYGNVAMPELEAGESAVTGSPSDFGNRTARNAAIQALMREGLAGGNSLESKVAQSQAMRAAGQASRQGSQAALQSAAARGMGGASSTLQAQLLGASQGADRAAQVGLEGANNARRNALMALQQGGGMAGTAEAQDSERDLARKAALDRMAMFNAGQRQQQFQNDLSVRDRRYDATQTQARHRSGKAQGTRQRFGGLGQAAGYAAANWPRAEKNR